MIKHLRELIIKKINKQIQDVVVQTNKIDFVDENISIKTYRLLLYKIR